MQIKLKRALRALETMATDRWLTIEESLREEQEKELSEDARYVIHAAVLALFMNRAQVDPAARNEAILLLRKFLNGEPVVVWEYHVYQDYVDPEDKLDEWSVFSSSGWRENFDNLDEAIACLNSTAFRGHVKKWQKDPITGESSSSMAYWGGTVYEKKEGIPYYTEGRRQTLEALMKGKIFEFENKTWRIVSVQANPVGAFKKAIISSHVECEEVIENEAFPLRKSLDIRMVRRLLHLNEWGQPMQVLNEAMEIPVEKWRRYAEFGKTQIDGKPFTFKWNRDKGECLLPVRLSASLDVGMEHFLEQLQADIESGLTK